MYGMLIYLSECALDTFFSNRKEKHVKQLMCDELTFVDAINCIIMLDVCQHVRLKSPFLWLNLSVQCYCLPSRCMLILFTDL